MENHIEWNCIRACQFNHHKGRFWYDLVLKYQTGLGNVFESCLNQRKGYESSSSAAWPWSCSCEGYHVLVLNGDFPL